MNTAISTDSARPTALVKVFVILAMLIALLGVTALGNSPIAHAGTQATVVTGSGPGSTVNVRQGPGTDTEKLRTIGDGTSVELVCHVRGRTFTGGPYNVSTDIWYRVPKGGFVTDAMLDTGSNAPVVGRCGSSAPMIGDTWVDCSGDTLCTKYFSRAKTQEMNSNFRLARTTDPRIYSAAAVCGTLGFLVGSAGTPLAAAAAAGMAGAACAAGAAYVTAESLGGVDKVTEQAASPAVNGCLQVAWRKDGTGTSTWGYTTHPDYCWDK